MSFQWPLALIGLVVVPVLIALYVLRDRRRLDYATRFTTPGLLPNLVEASPGWRRHLPLALLLVALTAMVVGVARPQAKVSVKRTGARSRWAATDIQSRSCRSARLLATMPIRRAYRRPLTGWVDAVKAAP